MKHFLTLALVTITAASSWAAPSKIQVENARARDKFIEQLRGTKEAPKTAKEHAAALVELGFSIQDYPGAIKIKFSHLFSGDKAEALYTLAEIGTFTKFYRDRSEAIKDQDADLAKAFADVANEVTVMMGHSRRMSGKVNQSSEATNAFIAEMALIPDMATWTPEQINSHVAIFKKFNELMSQDEKLVPHTAWAKAVRDIHGDRADQMLKDAVNCRRG